MKLERAKRLLDAAESAAEEIGVAMSLAIVDAAGHPVLVRRMDGASIISGETVVAKARTAVHFGRSTEDVVESARRNPVVYGAFLEASESTLVYSMGGLLVLDPDGSVAGAVGASGGTGAQDIEVSTAAIEADRS